MLMHRPASNVGSLTSRSARAANGHAHSRAETLLHALGSVSHH